MAKKERRIRIAGFDCAEEIHEVVVLDDSGDVVQRVSVVNEIRAVEDALCELLLSVQDSTELVVVVESGRSHGRLVCDVARRLGCSIVQVNTVALNHYRHVEGQPRKTDRWDAYLAARMTYQRLKGCREIVETRPEERALCRLTRTHSRLVDERSALWARVRAQLIELAPEMLHRGWQGPKHKSKALQYLLERWPGLSGLENAQARSVEKVLRSCHYGDEAAPVARLLKQTAAQITMEAGERRIVALEISVLIAQIKTIEVSLLEIDREIELQVNAHPIGIKLLEVPGIAHFTAGVLIGELLPVVRVATESQSATYSGLTPLARQSGKRLNQHRLARGVNKRILHAVYQSSVSASKCSAIDRAYYEKKLADYSGHPVPTVAAYIALSRQRHKVIYVLMRTEARYDKETLISSHLNRIKRPRRVA